MAIATTNVRTNLHSDVVEAKTHAADLEAAGQLIVRYGLVLVVAWIGAMKFTAY